MQSVIGDTIENLIMRLPLDCLNHMMNVGRLVRKVEEWIGSGVQQCEALGIAAFFHDIGKLYVPDAILSKPSKLTAQEFQIVQQHPIYGRDLLYPLSHSQLSNISEHLGLPASDAAAYHHERWDGKGYPFGLQGKDIPFIARVTAVCDAYDAMITRRAYRQAFSPLHACMEVARHAGTQFDPELARVFLNHKTELNKVYEHEPIVAGTFLTLQEVKRLLCTD